MVQAFDGSIYGTDIDWGDDMSATCRMVAGIRLLAQRAMHRLSTPRGMCLDSPDDGLDLAEFLSKGLTPTELASIPGEVENELRKDEAFLDASVTPTRFDDGLHLAITITPSAGPDFDLVLGVGPAGVKLLSVSGV